MYPGTDGNPEKLAVRGLSLALPRGECFGMLGPNGAGKTSFISMVSCEKNNMITEAEIICLSFFCFVSIEWFIRSQPYDVTTFNR